MGNFLGKPRRELEAEEKELDERTEEVAVNASSGGVEEAKGAGAACTTTNPMQAAMMHSVPSSGEIRLSLDTILAQWDLVMANPRLTVEDKCNQLNRLVKRMKAEVASQFLDRLCGQLVGQKNLLRRGADLGSLTDGEALLLLAIVSHATELQLDTRRRLCKLLQKLDEARVFTKRAGLRPFLIRLLPSELWQARQAAASEAKSEEASPGADGDLQAYWKRLKDFSDDYGLDPMATYILLKYYRLSKKAMPCFYTGQLPFPGIEAVQRYEKGFKKLADDFLRRATYAQFEARFWQPVLVSNPSNQTDCGTDVPIEAGLYRLAMRRLHEILVKMRAEPTFFKEMCAELKKTDIAAYRLVMLQHFCRIADDRRNPQVATLASEFMALFSWVSAWRPYASAALCRALAKVDADLTLESPVEQVEILSAHAWLSLPNSLRYYVSRSEYDGSTKSVLFSQRMSLGLGEAVTVLKQLSPAPARAAAFGPGSPGAAAAAAPGISDSDAMVGDDEVYDVDDGLSVQTSAVI